MEICIAGGAVITGTVIYVVTKRKFSLIPKDQKVICWNPNNSFFNLERVKAILDANKNTSAQFAIFREGPNLNEYAIIVTDGFQSFIAP